VSRNTPHCLGVLGGMGPLAGAHFAVRLVQLTPATCDQDHIPVLLRNNPRIPDRSSAWVSGGASPLPAMMRGVAMLQDAGADCIAIPCNTAHLWFEQLQAATSARVLHIVEAVIRDLRNQGVQSGRVGILGTRATLETGLYQRFLVAAGYEPLVPTRHDVLQDCTEAIVAVKASRVADALAPLTRSIEALRLEGASAVALGCTELPIALTQAHRDNFGVVIIDCIDALAREAVRQFKVSSPPELVQHSRGDRIATGSKAG
jgi:aspartate racemase